MTCATSSCEGAPLLYPVFSIAPVGAEERVRGVLKIPLCAGCASALRPEEFYTDSVWPGFRDRFRAIWHGEPDRQTAEVEFTPIGPVDEAWAEIDRNRSADMELH